MTKDNFEALFERLGVSLQLPVMEAPLSLLEFDDLHPDYLYSRVPLFRQFIELEKKLLRPEQFSQAAEEIQQWRPELREAGVRDAKAAENLAGMSLLDSILSSRDAPEFNAAAPEGQIDKLIKDIVAPYVQGRPDRRQETYLQAVREAASEAMRKIMHNSDFRQLEASWRSLHFLLRRVEDHPGLQLHLIDVSKDELLADLALADGDLEQSQLFKCLVQRETVAGNRPYNVILGDFFIADEARDLHLLVDLATIAEAAGSTLLLGGDSRLAGCPSLAGSLDPEDWHYPLAEEFVDGWQAVRDYPASEFVALAAPRFMLRLPYGEEAATTDCFDFEELTAEHGHQYYLWGNSAYLLALSIISEYTQSGTPSPVTVACFTDLPLHLRNLPQGRWMTPCAEALLTDRAAAHFTGAGISTLRSVQGRDEILLPSLQSLAGTSLRGPWG
ncbi:type VI secretion system contractile sheath domain-containing protein [Microbulbifer hainanensis]|uniref:type VI secretion system contractile sheath domain-containing protein n=1 Tax=Microbulbifer hainanensis TaxID=2735675 RepID=UPI0018691E75|nr:type VI secretion system contractile sheath large subunit [Microbulbifer hainanensis]